MSFTFEYSAIIRSMKRMIASLHTEPYALKVYIGVLNPETLEFSYKDTMNNSVTLPTKAYMPGIIDTEFLRKYESFENSIKLSDYVQNPITKTARPNIVIRGNPDIETQWEHCHELYISSKLSIEWTNSDGPDLKENLENLEKKTGIKTSEAKTGIKTVAFVQDNVAYIIDTVYSNQKQV
jgi:hypothetical protein